MQYLIPEGASLILYQMATKTATVTQAKTFAMSPLDSYREWNNVPDTIPAQVLEQTGSYVSSRQHMVLEENGYLVFVDNTNVTVAGGWIK